MDNTRQQIVDSINANSNILVTVSTDPSVDELAAALGLTILLNNLEKRATAVASGTIPAAINFLEPDKTFENTADSLRDFIIALDKEKADHLRYKVDGDVVKIFITPYRTTLTQKDLDFSQGDYNVELVIAIGVKDQDHLDKALAAHGKILHDAAVVTVTAGNDTSSLGSVDWHDPMASSLSEMMVSLADALKTEKPLLDEQISTAFLTGIVSATDRFSNDHTTSRVMTMAAQLMAAGANQQLIAAKLAEAHDIGPGAVVGKASDKPAETTEEKPVDAPVKNSNELSIDRPGKKSKKSKHDDAPAVVDVPAPVSESEPGEQELEAQLAAVTAATPVAESMADIEQALQEATGQLDDVAAPEPVQQQDEPAVEPVVISDEPLQTPTLVDEQPQISSPGAAAFQPAPSQPGLITDPVEVPAPEPVPLPPPLPEFTFPPLPEQEPVVPAEPSMIINDHGTFSDQPPSTSQPINSINAGPVLGDASIDPFAPPINQASDATANGQPTPQENSFEPIPAPVTPLDSAQFGTEEGAAQLGAMPSLGPVPQPEPARAPIDIPSLPPLPPLPPLPTDGSLPPLPPPPPLPSLGQPVSMPSGAVSGDIFGDAPATEAPAAPAPASEPGQFRIPGQG